jgi:hypothetical protein
VPDAHFEHPRLAAIYHPAAGSLAVARTKPAADLAVAGVRDAPDRPGCELVFVARRRR